MLKEALAGRDLIPAAAPGADEKERAQTIKREPLPQPFETGRIHAMKQQVEKERAALTKDSPYEMKYAPRPLAPNPKESTKPEENAPAPEKVLTGEQVSLTDVLREDSAYGTDFLAEVKKSNVTIIGQLFDTYWLVQAEEQLYIIDQHAAHEKVLFERNLKAFKDRAYSSQQLSPPAIVSLSMQQEQALLDHRDALRDMGFEIEEFGGREYSLLAVPDNLYGLDAKQLLLDFLDDCISAGGTAHSTPETIWSRLATASCKAAVKGNQRISRPEVEELLRELLTLENPYHCPHGRPTMISMSKYEIEKKFKRIV
jgi:DNA mismatch repair protein MutL